eukprot:jgi/Bigna1/84320/fgenesh1_pg.129_\
MPMRNFSPGRQMRGVLLFLCTSAVLSTSQGVKHGREDGHIHNLTTRVLVEGGKNETGPSLISISEETQEASSSLATAKTQAGSSSGFPFFSKKKKHKGNELEDDEEDSGFSEKKFGRKGKRFRAPRITEGFVAKSLTMDKLRRRAKLRAKEVRLVLKFALKGFLTNRELETLQDYYLNEDQKATLRKKIPRWQLLSLRTGTWLSKGKPQLHVNLDVEEEGKKTLKSAIGAEEDDYVPEGMKDKRPKETLAREKEKSQIPKDEGPDDEDVQPKEGRKNAKKGEGGDDEEGEEDEEDQDKEGKRPEGKGRKPGESTKEPQRDGKKGPNGKAPENGGKGSKDTAGVDGKQPEDSKNAPNGGSEDTSSSSNGKPGEDARNGAADRAATSSTSNDPNSPANGGGGSPNGLYADRPQQPCNNFARLTPENVDAWKEAKPCPKSNSGNGLGGRSRRDSGGSKPGKIWFFGSDSAAKGKAKEDRPIEYWDQFIDGNGKDVNTQSNISSSSHLVYVPWRSLVIHSVFF